MALLESMSAGCLPIVFRVGGMPEVIDNSDLGWVVEPDNTTAFAEAMEEASSLDENMITERKAKILHHIKNNFDSDKSFEKIVDVFKLETVH